MKVKFIILFVFLLSLVSFVAFAEKVAEENSAAIDNADDVAGQSILDEQSKDHHSRKLNFLDWDGGEDGHTPPLVYMFINFIIVGFLVFFILRKGLGAKIKNRKQELEDALEEANALKYEAEKALAFAKEKSENMNLEMAKIKESILGGAKAEAQNITDESKMHVDRMHADTSALITQEIARMSLAIKTEVIEEIISMAEKKLIDKMQKGDQDKLSVEYLQDMRSFDSTRNR